MSDSDHVERIGRVAKLVRDGSLEVDEACKLLQGFNIKQLREGFLTALKEQRDDPAAD